VGRRDKQEMYKHRNTYLMENLNKPGNYIDVTHNTCYFAVNVVCILLELYAAYTDSLLPTFWRGGGVSPETSVRNCQFKLRKF